VDDYRQSTHPPLARALDTVIAPRAGPVLLELRDDIAAPNMYFTAHGLSTMGYAMPAANLANDCPRPAGGRIHGRRLTAQACRGNDCCG
jgi:thiamine pyrophosphate-dependent acetolactate synthase large subunit-like protein